jgi:hypothetical protein
MRTRKQRLASATVVVTEEQNMTPSHASTGAGAQDAPSHARLASLLRDAARATERNWNKVPSRTDPNLAALALTATLEDLRVFCTRLSACCRLHAMNEQTPSAFARAALVHSAACFLHQAWLVLSDTGISVTGHAGHGSPADPIEQAARECVAQWQPAATVDPQVLELLADAIGVLASTVGMLADSTAQSLGAVHACVRAAAGQLRAACAPAVPTGPGPAAAVVGARTT